MTPEKPRGEVITFYSFKGGVGRTMALANVAAIYAQQGKKVLALDFDFEAPGLHRYFLKKNLPDRYSPPGPQQGVLNLFEAIRRRIPEAFPQGQELVGHEAESTLRGLVGELLDAGEYVYRVQVENPNESPSDTSNAAPVIDFIAAGRFDAAYPTLLRDFDWVWFYDDYAEVFPAFVNELKSRYDYILVDSRTGVTDIGGICTMVLPDKLVLVVTTNEQSLAGAIDAGWQAVDERRESTIDERPLAIFPLVSRIEESEEIEKRTWFTDARARFERMFVAAYQLPQCDLKAYFDAVRIPHRGYFSYGERIAAEEQPASQSGSLAQAYDGFAGYLKARDAREAQLGKKVRDYLRHADESVALDVWEPRDMSYTLSSFAKRMEQHSEYESAVAVYERLRELAQAAGRDDIGVEALHGAGFARFLQAKLAWGRGDAKTGRALFEAAAKLLSSAAALRPDDPTFARRAGYALFLLDKTDEARALVAKAITLGGQAARRGALEDSEIRALPQDAAFRELVASIPEPPAAASPA